MNRNRIGKLKLIELLERILNISVILELNRHLFREKVDIVNDTHVTIKHPHAMVNRYAILSSRLPLKLIIVLYLHYLIALAKQCTACLLFLLGGIFWIKVLLKNHIKSLNPKKPFSCRSQHLNVEYFSINILGKLLSNKRYHRT